MAGAIIDGKAFAATLREKVGEQAARFALATGRKAGLAVVLVGEDPASQVYVRSKGKQTVEAGMASFEHRLPADAPEDELLALVERLNADPAVDGILVQLPLPGHMDEQKVIAAIDPGQGCRRLPRHQCRTARGRPARLRAMHPAGLPDAAEGPAGRSVRARCGGDRTLEHRRQARWRNCCCAKAAPSPSRIAAPATCPRWCGAPTSWSPQSAGPKWCAATGSSPVRW